MNRNEFKHRINVRRTRRAAEKKDAALEAAERGWRVFPLTPKGKRPVINNWQTRATTDTDRIERCWTPAGKNHGQWNIGIACGPSSLLAIDLDVAKPGEAVPAEYEQTDIRTGAQVLADLEGAHGDLPNTYRVSTPSGGSHLYFTAPDTETGVPLGNSAGKLGWLIDTRGAGGYLVGAGSRTRDGKPYTAANYDLEPAELPDWITEQLTPREQGFALDLPDDERRRAAYVEAAVRNEVAKVLKSAPHTHNTTLFVASASLGRLAAAGELDVHAIRGALVAAGEAVGQPPDEARATVDSGLRNGGIKTTTRGADRHDGQIDRHKREPGGAGNEAGPAEPEPTAAIEEPRTEDRPEITNPNGTAHIWNRDGACTLHPNCATNHQHHKATGAGRDPKGTTAQPARRPPAARSTDPIERARHAMTTLTAGTGTAPTPTQPNREPGRAGSGRGAEGATP